MYIGFSRRKSDRIENDQRDLLKFISKIRDVASRQRIGLEEIED